MASVLDRRIMGSALEAAPERSSAAAAADRPLKWRVGVRLAPPSRREPKLVAAETHPLVATRSARSSDGATAAAAMAQSAREQSAVEKLDALMAATVEDRELEQAPKQLTRTSSTNKAELIVLQDGDLDPLGALLSLGDTQSRPGNNSLKKPATVSSAAGQATAKASASSAMVETMPQTMKDRWTAHKDRVLAKYATHTFKIKASMLEIHELEHDLAWTPKIDYQRADDGVASDGLHVIKKTRARLEQFERKASESTSGGSSKGDPTLELTQSEYIARIHKMEKELIAAWDDNRKVEALRIAIKCVKLLADTTTCPQLYPCAYVLVTDVLDCFGRLVFERIKTRASEDENGQPLPKPLSDTFTSADVNIHAKETCRNWFYKTACIRELLPRIFIEIALLKCYRFLCDNEYEQIVARLSNMIKGVGEPMVALYTRLYLGLVSSELLPSTERTAVLSSLYDYFFAFQSFQLHSMERWLSRQNMTQAEYLSLHSPAIEWLMKCAAQSSDPSRFATLVAHYQQFSGSSMVLKHICESFGPEFYAAEPLEMFHLMRMASPSHITKCHLYSVLAVQLSTSSVLTSTKAGKLQFLNEAWTSITAQEDIAQYMECAAAFMKLIVAHFSHREALILLKDVVRHFNSATPEDLTTNVYNLLGALIENVVYGSQHQFEFFTRLIPSAEFLTLMGMFKHDASVSVAKKVLQAFVGAGKKRGANGLDASLRLHVVGPEAAVAHTLFVICCRVHDALDSLSTPTELTDATKDICAFIERLGVYTNANQPPQQKSSVSSGGSLEEEQEALLMLYIDCRSAFYKLEPVKATLSTYVMKLAMQVHRHGLRGSNSKKTKNRHNFVKSCLAYAHITIPSISDPWQKLDLMTLCANVALINNCLPQMDAFLRAAIMLIPELDINALECEDTLVLDDASSGMSSPLLMLPLDMDPLSRRRRANSDLVGAIGSLVSVLVYAPCLNDDDPFYFVKALRKAVLERLPWSMQTIERRRVAAASARVRILMYFLQLFALWGQPSLPQRLSGVDSNDVLYGGSEEFNDQVQLSFSRTIEEIIREIEAIGSPDTDDAAATSAAPVVVVPVETLLVQIELMLDFLNHVVPVLDMEDGSPSFDSIDTILNPEGGGGSTGSRRRKRTRSGAHLVRKCMLFTFKKAQELSQATKDPHAAAAVRQAQWLHGFYATTQRYLADFIHTMRLKAVPTMDSSKQAVQALDDCIRTSTWTRD